MLGYVTIGTNDMAKATAFYDALLAEVDGKQVMGMEHIKFYGATKGGTMLAVVTPHDKNAQQCGNGNMVAIPGGSAEGAKRLYEKAIELGATDEGKPGDRMPTFYGAYVRDLDGNKLCFYHMQSAG